jgi:hypothetical protein
MTCTHDACTSVSKPGNGRQGSPNAKVISDGSRIIRPDHRHVEVGADQNRLAAHLAEVF